MGFFNRLAKKVKQEVQQERHQVYCQYCGGELTENGGDISYSGKIYCNIEYMLKRAPCGMIAFIRDMDHYNYAGMKYHDSTKVQKAIKDRKLIHFGELEKKVKDPTQKPK